MDELLAKYVEYLRALLKQDFESSARHFNDLPDGEWPGSGRLNTALFGLSVRQRFGKEPDPRAIKAFVDAFMVGVNNSAEKVKPIHVEMLIRSVLGESDLFDEVPHATANTVMPSASYLMVKQLGFTPDQVDQLIDKAIERANR
ncbi:hypothetical protein [Glycomyces sp. YM15]|uniref:hypothetical protein n=1 Tax=Glycomyces sp. YM15 TaxID=2800446 RepID=UPI001965EFBC|nr:hypothetical protein [Glycomyces sp. YM15]